MTAATEAQIAEFSRLNAALAEKDIAAGCDEGNAWEAWNAMNECAEFDDSDAMAVQIADMAAALAR